MSASHAALYSFIFVLPLASEDCFSKSVFSGKLCFYYNTFRLTLPRYALVWYLAVSEAQVINDWITNMVWNLISFASSAGVLIRSSSLKHKLKSGKQSPI